MSSMDNDTSHSDRLPGPHLTPQGRLSHIAHHDGLQPTQHVAVWNLPPQGGPEGPYLHLPRSTASRCSTYIELPSACVAHVLFLLPVSRRCPGSLKQRSCSVRPVSSPTRAAVS